MSQPADPKPATAPPTPTAAPGTHVGVSPLANALPLERGARALLSPVLANWWLPLAVVGLILLGNWIEEGKRFLGIKFDNYWGLIAINVGINLTLAVSLQLINGIAGQFSLGHAGFMGVGAYVGGYAVTAHGARVMKEGEDAVAWTHPGGALVYVLAILLTTLIAGGIAFGVVWAVRQLGRAHRRLPMWLGWAIIAWAVLDLMVKSPDGTHHLGALKAAGGSAAAVAGLYDWLMRHGEGPGLWLTLHLPGAWRRAACLIVSLGGAAVMAAIVGLVVGLPTLRLKGDYLAIATLGVSALIGTIITNCEPWGRANGLSVVTFAQDADPDAGLSAYHFVPWIYGVALLTTLVVWRVQHSPKGRALQCLREDEIASGAVGIDVTSHKVLAFVIGAFFAGMAGALFAHQQNFITPKQFDMTRSVELVVMVTLGGLGSIPGTIIACVLLTLLQPALQTARQWLPGGTPGWVLTGADYANTYRLVIYALLLITAMLARSRGWLTFGRRQQGTLASAT